MTIIDTVKKITKKTEIAVKSSAKDLRKNKLPKDKIAAIILEPVFTEKTSNMLPLNKYVFKVANGSGKNEVKKAVEGLYGVNVINVNILKTSDKPRRVGRHATVSAGFKKAIVTLKQGESVDFEKK